MTRYFRQLPRLKRIHGPAQTAICPLNWLTRWVGAEQLDFRNGISGLQEAHKSARIASGTAFMRYAKPGSGLAEGWGGRSSQLCSDDFTRHDDLHAAVLLSAFSR